MSSKGNASRRRHRFIGPSRFDMYTVWVDFPLRQRRRKATEKRLSEPKERALVFNTVAKALRGKGARSTGRKWLTKMSGPSSREQSLAVFMPGCSKAKARAEKVNKVLKRLGLKSKAKVFHEALYSTSVVRKCPRY